MAPCAPLSSTTLAPITFSASSGVFTQYVAETETSASGEFVIRGGSGTGELIANGGNDSIGVFNGVNVNEVFTSNFLAPLPIRNGNQIVTIPFTFGVPFVLTVSDDMQLSAATGVGRALEVEDGTFWNALFSVYDSNGNHVADASISEVPEVSSIWLLVAVLGVVGPITCSRTRRARPRRRELAGVDGNEKRPFWRVFGADCWPAASWKGFPVFQTFQERPERSRRAIVRRGESQSLTAKFWDRREQAGEKYGAAN